VTLRKSNTNENNFIKASNRPTWEGIILTDLDFNDQRISIFMTETHPQLKDYIESIWYLKWNLNETENLRCILAPNPCAKLVTLQQNNQTFPSLLIGANKEADIFELRGTGSTVGIDFKPGGLFPFISKTMNGWPKLGVQANGHLKDFPLAPQENWTETDLSLWIKSLQIALLKSLEVSKKNNYDLIALITKSSLEGTIKSPEEMASTAGVTLRTLQRIFQEEVGISPRELLRIARFNEAIRKISEHDFKSFADTALESGFFDQPHMANEFKKLVATPPNKFRRYL
jgi:AraC-like DNA-binding protein